MTSLPPLLLSQDERVRVAVASTVAELRQPECSRLEFDAVRSTTTSGAGGGRPTITAAAPNRSRVQEAPAACGRLHSMTPPRRKRGPPPSLASLAVHAAAAPAASLPGNEQSARYWQVARSLDSSGVAAPPPLAKLAAVADAIAAADATVNPAEVAPIFEIYEDHTFLAGLGDDADKERERLRQERIEELRSSDTRGLRKISTVERFSRLCGRTGKCCIFMVFLMAVVITMAWRIDRDDEVDSDGSTSLSE